jgi:hypothetical protein
MGAGRISVRIATGLSKPKAWYFIDRGEAVHFAESKMGRKGVAVDTTLMSSGQLATHQARDARAAALIEQIQREMKD